MPRLRRFCSRLHLWLGLLVGGYLAVMGVSGSVLVFSAEIEHALAPALHRVRPQPQRVPLDALVGAVAARHDGARPTRLRFPKRPDGSVEVWLGGTADVIAYVDPYSGRYLGAVQGNRTPTGFLFDLHAKLLAGETGETLVGLGAVGLLLLAASGAVLWWPGRRNLRKGLTVKRGAPRRRQLYDLHRAGGFYSLAFLVLTAGTGFALVFHEPVQAALDAVTRSPARPAPPQVPPPAAGARPLPLQRLLDAAERRVGAGHVTYLTLPQKPEAPFVVRRRLPDELHPNGRTFVYVDPFTAAVLAVELAHAAPAGTRFYNLFYPLHIGDFGGLPVRLLWVLLGLAPALLFATGFFIWRSRLKPPARQSTTPAAGYRLPAAGSRSPHPPAPSPACGRGGGAQRRG